MHKRVKTWGGAAALLVAVATSAGAASAGTASPAAPSAVPKATASFNGTVRVVDYHGRVAYVGGDFTTASQGGVTYQRRHLAAVDATTGALLPWNPGANRSVQALRVRRTWTYVGGTFTRVHGRRHVGLARVATRTGTVDATFRPEVSGNVRALAVSRTALYAGGGILKTAGHKLQHLAAFRLRTGALRPSWHARTDGGVNVLSIAHRRLYVGGAFHHVNGLVRGHRLAPLGLRTATLERGYYSSVHYPVYDLVVGSTRIYAAADGPGGHVLALGLKGSARWNLTTDGGAHAITLLGRTVYVGGHFDNTCTSAHPGVAGGCATGMVLRRKFLAASVRDGALQAWAPQADSALGTLSIDSSTATDQIVAGGAWTTFDKQVVQPAFAEFGPS